jgi:hypothetical protein
MAENVRETGPPEPPPKPPEVPKPTEQSSRSETLARPDESQESAHRDARQAAQSEHAKATSGGDPEGLRPTPEVETRLDEQSAAKNGPEGLRPTPEFQERLDAHTAARQAAAAERAKATEGAVTAVEGVEPQSSQEMDQPVLDNGHAEDPVRAAQPPEANRTEKQSTAHATDESTLPGEAPNAGEAGDRPPGPRDSGYTGPERRQYEAQHLDPGHDLRKQPTTIPADDNATDQSVGNAAPLRLSSVGAPSSAAYSRSRNQTEPWSASRNEGEDVAPSSRAMKCAPVSRSPATRLPDGVIREQQDRKW